MISEEKKFFDCGNRNTNPSKFCPILEERYSIIKDADGAAKNLAIIHPGCQKINSVSTS